MFENLPRADEGTFLYTLASSKTNHNGKVRPEDVKPVVGSAAEALEAWLKASGITSGPLFRRILKNGKLGTDGFLEQRIGTSGRRGVRWRAWEKSLSDELDLGTLTGRRPTRRRTMNTLP